MAKGKTKKSSAKKQTAGTQSQRLQLYRRYMRRIEAAKKRTVVAEASIYELCYEIVKADLWRASTFKSFVSWLRSGAHVDSNRAQAYIEARDLLTHNEIVELGLDPTFAMVRIFLAYREEMQKTGFDPDALFKQLHAVVLQRVIEFRQKNRASPSRVYAVTLVEERARGVGIPVPLKRSHRNTLQADFAFLVNTTKAVIKLLPHKPTEARRLAVKALDELGQLPAREVKSNVA